MLCPSCGTEMAVYGDPQITAVPVGNTKQKFPDKLQCGSSTIYTCPKCPTKAVYTENQDYVPYVKPVIEMCKNDGSSVCNAGYACDACPMNAELKGKEELND